MELPIVLLVFGYRFQHDDHSAVKTLALTINLGMIRCGVGHVNSSDFMHVFEQIRIRFPTQIVVDSNRMPKLLDKIFEQRVRSALSVG